MMRMEQEIDMGKLTGSLQALSRALDPNRAAADRVLTAAVHSAITQIREGHDPYWTLLHAGLACEPLIGRAA